MWVSTYKSIAIIFTTQIHIHTFVFLPQRMKMNSSLLRVCGLREN